MNRIALAACCGLVVVSLCLPGLARSSGAGAPAAPKVSLAARPFPLTDVDGQRIATVNLPYHPTELLDDEYALPPAAAAGKTTVVVRFQAAPDAPTAAVFDVRIVPAS